MHIDFRVKINEVNSNKNKRFTPQEIDWVLNDQMDEFVETRSTPKSNNKVEGFEETQKRLDDIRTVIKEATTNATRVTTYNLIQLTLGTFNRGRSVEVPSSGDYIYRKLVSDSSDTVTTCTNHSNAPNRLFSSEIVQNALKDEFHTSHPESPISELVGSTLRVYENDFTIADINIFYVYQYPRIKYDSIDSTDCILPIHTHREIVDMAVSKVNAKLNTGNYEKYLNEISKNE